ncbi:hypothetical protein PR048_015514 [Dryococelus australis]|uniref:Uncharacterized protein n=1 Tax=Dryococelus australis TaxID=614101 RepID=A0ABQ9HHF6_9NEOP|nr:hypothetical protein PR048_015514 [Dryococelus australis]
MCLQSNIHIHKLDHPAVQEYFAISMYNFLLLFFKGMCQVQETYLLEVHSEKIMCQSVGRT